MSSPYAHQYGIFSAAAATATATLPPESFWAGHSVYQFVTTGFSGTLDFQGRPNGDAVWVNLPYSALGATLTSTVAQLSYTTDTSASLTYVILMPMTEMRVVMTRSAGSITGWGRDYELPASLQVSLPVSGLPAAAAEADAIANATDPAVRADQFGFNATTWDRWRNNVSVTALASAVRAATTSSSDITNYNGRGAVIHLDVTNTPNDAQTLTLAVQVKDPVTAKYTTITAFTALTASVLGANPTTATFVYTVYPGGAETAAVANHEVQSLVLPRTWRIQVAHSAAGNFTYSVGATYVV